MNALQLINIIELREVNHHVGHNIVTNGSIYTILLYNTFEV